MTEPVLSEVADGVGVITLNRPQARTAVDKATTDALVRVVDDFEARDDVVVLVLTGAGGTFCSGMDLKAFSRGELPSVPGRGCPGRRATIRRGARAKCPAGVHGGRWMK